MLNYENVCISVYDKAKINAIVEAACEYYEIIISGLLSNTSRDIIAIRQYCYFLIKINTSLNSQCISHLFNKSDTSIRHGIDKVTSHSSVYADVIYNLRVIGEKATIKCKSDIKTKFL